MATLPAIPAGVAVGFHVGLPSRIEAAWLVVAKHEKNVVLLVADDAWVRITLRRDRWTPWILAGALILGSVLALLITVWLSHGGRALYERPFATTATKLQVFAWAGLGSGILLMMINLATGGIARESKIEVKLGRLRIDHYISGDHIVREYSHDDIEMIWNDGAIEIGAKKGAFPVGAFIPTSLQDALVEIIGVVLWGDRAVVTKSGGNTWTSKEQIRIAVEPAVSQNA